MQNLKRGEKIDSVVGVGISSRDRAFIVSSFSLALPLSTFKFNQRSFISKMKWAPLKSLFVKIDGSTIKLIVPIASGVSSKDRPCF